MSASTNHREKSLITVSDYAKKKNVSRTAVYHQINVLKNIKLVYVGIGKYPYLDWSDYKDFPFDDNRKRR